MTGHDGVNLWKSIIPISSRRLQREKKSQIGTTRTVEGGTLITK